MAFSVLANDIYSEIQYTLLEPRDGGVAWPSGLYTASEMAERLNQRLREFYKRTALITSRDTTQSITPNQRDQPYPSDMIDIIRLGVEILDCSAIAASVLVPATDLPDLSTADGGGGGQLSLYDVADGGTA